MHPPEPWQRLWHWPSSLIQKALYVAPGAGLLSILTSMALMICCSSLPLLHTVVLKQRRHCVRRTKNRKKQFFSAVSSESAEIFSELRSLTESVSREVVSPNKCLQSGRQRWCLSQGHIYQFKFQSRFVLFHKVLLFFLVPFSLRGFVSVLLQIS